MKCDRINIFNFHTNANVCSRKYHNLISCVFSVPATRDNPSGYDDDALHFASADENVVKIFCIVEWKDMLSIILAPGDFNAAIDVLFLHKKL